MQVTSYRAAQATLADYPVPPAPEATTGIAWLRATVARFSTGPAHTRRRAIAVAQLSTIDIAALRESARTATIKRLAPGLDLMTVARTLPIELLAAALDLPAAAPPLVAAIARAYPAGTPDPAADAAIELLAETPDETTAARIGLLAQAATATAGLIGNAAFLMLRNNLDDPAEAIIAETLRHTPPVRATTRITPTGDPITIDLAAANRDTDVFPNPDLFDPTRANREAHLDFGSGPHHCPGRHLATAITAGVLDAIRNQKLLTQTLTYAPPATLQIPTHLEITPKT
jgi:cytochrome P450